ncbi:fibroblast growth factor receptor 4-like [Xenia sp. Carnegie-2017]|uniref:fibroblast growth factor receptor 4-like n=1 Tax=Xenia sp. Carnegie-2017 TaxID=2897299 RepID=UPI001F04F738|nr:fibroblast growth factor receptor 4-like [Xenia sp. Carnegie-2017]XP_046850981.1 fibroblast growth factor receptor 4-like [Xenia sp. Carnegie-2017]XP_046850982.1 fibroblast growth factor receptor 4-like [Xenia sp. Carnegie-2017]XP_046850983.1 fibroblast growth factor receptor 4-like [Xenia sp. Carnegie-2017]
MISLVVHLTLALVFVVQTTINSADGIAPPSFKTNVTSFKLEINARRADIFCKVLSEVENEYWFTRNGHRIKKSKQYRYEKNRALRLKKVQWTDAGEYVCYAKNAAGTVSRKITVSIFDPVLSKTKGDVAPVFRDAWEISSNFFFAYTGHSIKITCDAYGRPPPKIKWYKDDQLMRYTADGDPLTEHTMVLKFKDLKMKDQGFYKCFVWNRAGNISNTNEVRLQQMMITTPIPLPLENITVYEGDNATNTCKAMCDYAPWFEWYIYVGKGENKQRKTFYSPDLDDDEYTWYGDTPRYMGINFRINNVTKEDEKYYYCEIALDGFGESYTESIFFYLHVLPKPVTTLPTTDIFTTPLTSSKFLSFSTSGRLLEMKESVNTKESIQRSSSKSLKSLIILICSVVAAIFVGSVFLYFLIYKCKKHRKHRQGFAAYRVPINPANGRQMLSSTSSSISNRSTNPLLKSSRHVRLDSNLSHISEMTIHLDPEWEIDRENLNLLHAIGEGAFGKVLKAEAFDVVKQNSGKTIVAVKTLKDDATERELMDLISEAEVMKCIGRHKNIINLIGCCTQNGPPLIVVEFAAFGNLRQYLRERRPDRNGNTIPIEGEEKLCLRDFISFSYQIARGMEYLSGRKCIHRDLAARNILVSEDRVMKIADFGLARDIHQIDYYRKTTDGRLPVKWMALEALFERVYTTQSDVWSFGIVIWEMLTFGGTPYPSIPLEQLFDFLKNGYRMEPPVNCPQELYDLLMKCWNEEPYDRPTFTELVEELDDMLSKMTDEQYLDIGELVGPMQPQETPLQEPSSPSVESTCSSVFSHMEKAFDEDESQNTNPNSDPTSYEEICEITLSIPVAADVEC